MDRKGDMRTVVAVLLGLIATGIIIVLLGIFFSNTSITGNVVGGSEEIKSLSSTKPTQTCKEVQVPYEKNIETIEYYSETVPYIENVCNQEELPYKIENFVMNYNTCNEVKNDCESCWYGACNCVSYCVDKSISCSLDLTNLDNGDQGSWTINFLFYEQGKSNSIEEKEVSQFLYPQTTKTFTGVTRIQGSNLDDNANKDLACNYQRINLAQKNVCEEVTKYKEVQREKVVVKPTTDYKIETICE